MTPSDAALVPVLVVEDDFASAKLIAVVLSSGGCTVRIASDAGQAIELLSSWTPTVAVVDLKLPDISGLELIRIMRARDDLRALRIIAVTVSPDLYSEAEARAAGCDGYLCRPTDDQELIAAVRALLPTG